MMRRKQPKVIPIGDIPVRCSHCDHDQHYERNILLNTIGATMFGLDWLNRTARILICANCGKIQWFSNDPRPEQTREEDDELQRKIDDARSKHYY